MLNIHLTTQNAIDEVLLSVHTAKISLTAHLALLKWFVWRNELADVCPSNAVCIRKETRHDGESKAQSSQKFPRVLPPSQVEMMVPASACASFGIRRLDERRLLRIKCGAADDAGESAAAWLYTDVAPSILYHPAILRHSTLFAIALYPLTAHFTRLCALSLLLRPGFFATSPSS